MSRRRSRRWSSSRSSAATRHPSLDDRFDPAIRIVAYDPAWPQRAADELARVRAALGDLVVRAEHIGSTAVSGLAAKPIVDLLLSVAPFEAERFVRPLEGLGYLHAYADDDRHFLGRPAERPRTHHLHVCAAGSATERRHLAVRDFLRAHPAEADAYGALKRAIATRHPDDRLAYMAGKDAYVAALEARALTWLRNSSAQGAATS